MEEVVRIRQLAKEQGIKLKFLCERLGVSATYFADVDNGKYKMSSDKIGMLAELLHTTPDYIMFGGEKPSREELTRIYMDFKKKNDKAHQSSPDPIRPSPEPHFDYDRFDERRIARHLTPDYVEAQLNLPEDYWEDVRDGYETPNTQLINKLAVLLETTYDYLMGLTDDPQIPMDDRTGVKIKLFGDVAAGIPIKQIDNFDPDDDSSWEEINRSTAKNGTYFALRIKGDSMATRIQNGDRVIVRYQETVESGQTAVVAINGDTATCKKVIWDDNGGMILMSNNPAYSPRYFTAEEIQKKPVRILGRVVEIRGEP